MSTISTTVKRNAGLRSTEHLRDALLRGEWQPGEKLQPGELAEVYDVSTTVIREALTRLAGNGLVETRPGKGFFVRELSLQELEDITELRCASDAIALRLSMERGDLEWESKLTAIHHRLSKTPRRDPDEPGRISLEWARLHREFHMAIISSCECEPMTSLSENLMLKTELYRQWAAPAPAAVQRDVEKEHLEILEAALDRDVALATERLVNHYQRSVDVVLDAGLLQEDKSRGA